MITVKNVTKIFSSNDWSLKALDDISENFREGEITAICGPSGSGKSTLLNAIASIENIDSGSIFVDSDDISKFSNIQLNEYRNKKIGIVFQSYFLEPSFSVAKNVSI
ncbi:MAG: ATP-binding cassette domain-containing protein, partial [Erysipelotrichaceae bacterium]